MKKKKKNHLNLRPLLFLILIIAVVFVMAKLLQKNSKTNTQNQPTDTRSTNIFKL
ncbi:MAG: hypothetical protein IJ690_00450 [Clostridia bacterium]|nr:hypothetical protein [Clostridia bacterium]